MKRKSLFVAATALLLSFVCIAVYAAPPTDGDFLYDLGSTGPTENQQKYYRDANDVRNVPRTDGYVEKKTDAVSSAVSATAELPATPPVKTQKQAPDRLAEGFDPETPDTPAAREYERKQKAHWDAVFEVIRQHNEAWRKSHPEQPIAKKVKCKGGKCGCTSGGECSCTECSCSDDRIAQLEKQVIQLQQYQEEQDQRLSSGIEGLRIQGEVIKDLLRGLVVAKPAVDRREPGTKSNPSLVRLVR